jgi:hypothetical protein
MGFLSQSQIRLESSQGRQTFGDALFGKKSLQGINQIAAYQPFCSLHPEPDNRRSTLAPSSPSVRLSSSDASSCHPGKHADSKNFVPERESLLQHALSEELLRHFHAPETASLSLACSRSSAQIGGWESTIPGPGWPHLVPNP